MFVIQGLTIIYLFFLVGGIQLQIAPSIAPAAVANYNFAIDTNVAGTQSTFQCIYQKGYKVVFSQVYSPANGGSVSSYGCQNIVNAYYAGMGTESYITPSLAGKTPAQQFDEAYNGMKYNGISPVNVWLQVTGPINWSSNIANNVNFITAFIARARSYNVAVGIYTNWYDWQQITGASTNFAKSAKVWYWSALGQGPNAEGSSSYDDFRPFGGWTTPNAKQFALNEYMCGLTLNRIVYRSNTQKALINASKLKDPVTNMIKVGGFV